MVEANDSSVDNDERGNKRLKLMQHEEEEEDRISALPDSIIKHILYFLPSTKEAIQTGILSKRWRKQWSRVPVLIFDFKNSNVDGKDCATWVENTISQYDCSKMKKFHIGYHFLADTSFTEKILFAVRRNVEELSILDYSETMDDCDDDTNAYILPEFIFDNAFLVKFTFLQCGFHLNRRVNWPSLKELTIDLFFLKDSGSIEKVLSGSPSLEFLTISFLSTRTPVTIASKSLKILSFSQYMIINENDVEISCPNLEELSIFSYDLDEPPIFPRKTLLNVLSRSPLLHSLTLHCFLEPPLVIASKSLKQLVLSPRFCAEVSCPNLEKLLWFGSDFGECKLINLPDSCRATLNFEIPELEGYCDDNLARKILVELQSVKELIVYNWFVKVLSALDMEKGPDPLLNVKCLTIKSPHFGHAFGILKGLCCSRVLETFTSTEMAFRDAILRTVFNVCVTKA